MPLTRLLAETESLSEARAMSEALEGDDIQPALATTQFEVPGTSRWRVDAYYEDAPDVAAVGASLAAIGTLLALTSEPVPDENWVAVSQAALPPVAAGRFVVHGGHDRAQVGHRLGAIEIDAGEAFGTAHHATTRGCLIALDRLMRSQRFRRVLDLGCGSGVLAIAAARALPHASITASDIDPIAVDVARGNLRRNRAGRRVRAVVAMGLAHPVIRQRRPFDLIVANILARPLIVLAPHLRLALSRGGVAVLSGLLASEAARVGAAYRAAGFDLAEKRIHDGWATLVLARR